MPNIYMTCGISGSGKTTFAKQFKEKVNAVEVSTGTVRAQVGRYTRERHDEVWNLVDAETERQVEAGNNVILTNSNLSYNRIKKWVDKFPLSKIILLIIEDSFNLQLCKNRIANRGEDASEYSKIPPEVSDEQYAKFHRLLRHLSTKVDTPKNLEVVMVSNTFELTTIEDLSALGERIDKSVFEKELSERASKAGL